MAFSSRAVANYFLSLAERDGKQITPLKLQKLVYYAHGWYLAITGNPLLNEQVEAWTFGPVVPSLYHDLKHFGSRGIKEKIINYKSIGPGQWKEYHPTIGEKADPNRETRAILDRVWKVYKNYSGIQLSNLAHEPDSPWYKVYHDYEGRVPKGTDIPTDSIRDFFRSRSKVARG